MSSSIDLYLAKQEGLVVEFVRRSLQAETKVTLLESTLQEINTQLEQHKTLVKDVFDTLKTTTIERDELKEKVAVLGKAYSNCKDDRTKLNLETSEMTSILNTLTSDNLTLKENYNLVMAELRKFQDTTENSTRPAVKKKPNKKVIKQEEQEWTYGE